MVTNAKRRRASASPRDDDAILVREAEKIVQALGAMFAPICEVVLHDLRSPDAAEQGMREHIESSAASLGSIFDRTSLS